MYWAQKTIRLTACLAVGLCGSIALADPADDQYAIGAQAYAARRWQAAADTFDAFRVEHPKHKRATDAIFFAGEARLQLQQFNEARSRFLSFIELAPGHPHVKLARFRVAEALFLKGDESSAAEELRAFSLEHPQDPLNANALAYLGEIELQTGNNADAEATYREILKQFPNGPLQQEARFGIARALEADSKVEGAVAMYRVVAAEHKNDIAADAALRVGVLLYRQREFDEAYESLAAFEAHFSDSSLQHEARYWRGMCLLDAGKPQDAMKTFEQAISKATGSPMMPGLHFGLAKAKLDDEPSATQLHEKIIDKWPLSAWSGDSLYVLMRRAAHNGNAATFDKLAAKQPTIAITSELASQLTKLIAQDALRRKQLDRAADAFELLGEHSKNDAAKAAILRARSLEQAEQVDAAVAAYRQASITFSDSDESAIAMFEGAKLQDRLGQDREAAALLEKLLVEHPDFVRIDAAIYQLAWTRVDLQQLDKANEHFERIVRDFPDSDLRADALYRLAESDFASRQFARASQRLQKVLREDPEPILLGHALYLQGQVAAEQFKWAEVLPPMEYILNNLPDHTLWLPANFWIAEAYFRQGDFDRAADEFGSLYEATMQLEDPWVQTVALRTAQVAAHQRRWRDAVDVARKIAARFPDFQQQYEADYLIGRSLSALGRFSEARDAFARVVDSPAGRETETAAMAQWMIGESFFHQKEYHNALRSYQRVNGLHMFTRWHSASLLQTGKCYEAIGDSNAAIKSYVQLIQRYPKSEFAEAAATRLRIARRQTTSTSQR